MPGNYSDPSKIFSAAPLPEPLSQRFSQEYVPWLTHALQGDFGNSRVFAESVLHVVAPAYWLTAKLSIATLFFAVLFGLTLGIFGAINAPSFSNSVMSFVALLLQSLPIFVLAIGLARWLRVPPIVLALLCLTYPIAFRFFLSVRRITQESITQPFIQAAIAKGLPMSLILRRHLLPCLRPYLYAQVATEFLWLLGGAVLIERIFALRGMGYFLIYALEHRDLPLLLGIATLMSVSTLIVTTLCSKLAHT